jgi:TP901 family phage tail tape measure protein
MKMEEQALRFKRVYGELFTTSDETDRMVKDIQALAAEYTKYGVAVEKTMGLAADAAAMGKQGADLLAQVAEATRLAVLGNVENEQALATTISLTNAFGTATDDLAKKINFLNAVENQTVTSIEDLTIAIPKAGPVIKQLGGDVEDLAFFLTAMKEGGINASEGANALKSGLASLINPTEKASEFMQGFGINLKGIVDSNKGDVKGIVIDFANALDKLDPLSRARSIEQLFGKFQFARLSTLFQNVIQEGNQASRVLKLTRNATEELAILSERELKRVEESTGYKFKKALEDLKASLIPLGEQFLKIVTPIAEFASKALAEFNKLSEGTKATITTVVTILGGVGPVALMTFGLLANGVANIIKLFATIKNVFARFSGAVTGAGTSVSYMTQEQLEAAAVAASLNQTHSQLIQTFTLEKASIDSLTTAYNKAVAAQARFNTGAVARGPVGGRAGTRKYNSGVLSVPGPKGAGDIVPAMLSPGEAVIPAEQSRKYSGFIRDMLNDDLPGYRFGRLGAAVSGFNPFGSMLRGSRVAVRTKQSDLQAMLQAGKGGRYQNAFVTGTGADYLGVTGLANPAQKKLREQMEARVLGFGPDTPASARPTYGYAKTSPLQALLNRMFGFKGRQYNSVTTDFPIGDRGQMFGYKDPKTGMFGPTPNFKSDTLSRYGDIDLITKRSVGKRSSAAVTDALMDYQRSGQYPGFRLSPVSMRGKGNFKDARFDRLSNPFGSYKSDPINRPNESTSNPQPPYIETYTPGGFAMSEVSRIIAKDRTTAKELQRLVDESGLKIRVTPQNAPPIIKILSSMFGSKFASGTAKVSKYNNGVVSVPGPKGKGDIVPAMLAPGEAVIPAKIASKYRGFISSMISGNIPGFLTGIDNVGKKDKDFINTFAQKYSNIPEMSPIIQKTIDRMNSEGIRITQGSFRAELKKDSGRLFELANTTARVSPTTGDSSAMTGLNATHGNAPITVTPDMARSLAAQVGEDSGFGRRLMESAATGKNSSAMSNLTFGMPAGFNRQEALMSGTDSADFVKKFPKLFMEPITAMYSRTISGLSADKLGVNQFAEIISKRLAAVGKKAVTEKMFYDIVKESMAEMKKLSPSSPALKALEKARNEFRVIQYGGGGGRRGELTKGLSFNANGQVVAASGAPNYRGDASRAAIAGGTSAANSFTERILARALKVGAYLRNLEGSGTATARATSPMRAPAAAKAGGQATSRKVPAKKFPGGFDINRVSSVVDKKGTFRYYYLDENGKRVPLAKLDYSKALGLDPKRIRELEKMALAETAQEAATPKRGGGFGKAAGISALAIGGLGLASNMMPQSNSQGEGQGGIDLVSGAIIASTVASIPMMFGKSIPEFLKSIGTFASKLPGWAKVVGLLATAIAPFTPQIIKAFTPLKDTEEYAKAFNNGLVNSNAQLDAIAKTFGRVASADIYERVRQNKFTPLSYTPGKTPFGDTFAASEQGKVFVEEYKKALAESGSKAAVNKLSQELSFSVISGIFTVDQAKSIAMTIGQQLEDMSIGVNVSASITGLLGSDGKKLESQTGDVLSRMITESGQPIQDILKQNSFGGSQEFDQAQDLINVTKAADRFFAGVPLLGPLLDGLALLSPTIDFASRVVNLDANELAGIVSATMSTIEGGRQALATFELIYDEKEATVEKEIEHARAIKDTAAEAKAIEKLESLQLKRSEERTTLQEAFTKQLQATEDIYRKTTNQGREDILGGFTDQFTNLYKDTPMSGVADAIKGDLERLKDNPFIVNIAAALSTGALKPESFNALLTGLEGKALETDILANVSSVIKTQGTQAGGELVTLLNKFADRSDLQLTLTALIKKDSANLDVFSLLGTIPGGEEVMEFYLDPKVNPNNLEDLEALRGNLKEVDELIKNGDFNMEKLLTLDLDIDEAAFDVLKENAEFFDKLPANQKKVFTSVFLSVLDSIDAEDVDNEMRRRASEAGGFGSAYYQSMKNDPMGEDKVKAELAIERAKLFTDLLNIDGGSGTPQKPAGDGGKKQTSFLDSMVKKVRDLFKATQKLTTGWADSKKALQGLNTELGGNIGKLFGGEGLSEKLRNAGVAESLIPGLMDLRDTDPKKFAELFVGGKISGGLNEFGQLANNIQIATASVESFAEAQSRSARVSVQSQTAITRLIGLGVSYSDALTMVEDENFAAMVATGRFNEEVARQIGLFNEAKKAAAGTLAGMTEEFNDAFSGAMARFAAEEEKIDIELRIKIADDEAIIAKVEEQIADIQDKNDDLDYGLGLIAEQEESINKEYDDRLDALDEVENANRRIASLQQKQISLAQAISEGDVFAAAKAMQDLEAANAEAFNVDSRDMLERERAAKLELATAEVMVDGQKKKLTRLEIEKLIKDNLKEIAKIEEEQLEPAQKRVREATYLADEAKRGLTIAGQTKLAWEEAANKIELAGLSVTAYDGKLATALASVNAIVKAWQDVKTAQDEANGGVSTSGVQTSPREGWTWDDDRGGWVPTAADEGTTVMASGGGGSASSQQFMSVGGSVNGKGTATSDSIPAMLSDGEYVVRASSVGKLGTGFLDYINEKGQVPGFAAGGSVNFRDMMAAAKKDDNKVVQQTIAKKIVAAQTTAAKNKLDPEKAKRDTLHKQGGFQGFEAGFQGMMADFGKSDIGKFIGDVYSADNLGGQVVRGALGVLSIPSEITGSLAKSIVESVAAAQKGDFLGAVGTAVSSPFRAVYEGLTNPFAGVIDPTKAKATMFEQAAQSAIDNNFFGAATNPEMAALAELLVVD